MSKIVFVSDLFVNQHAGGAELTTEALIEACPFEYVRINAHEVTIETLHKYQNSFWIFGNFSKLNLQLLPSLVGNIRYCVLEYDYKFCKYRSIERHKHIAGEDCDCHDSQHGKLISAFYHGASQIFWMSSEQENVYIERFPFLESNGRVLGSVFSKDDLDKLEFLKGGNNTDDWLVQQSESWIKGTDNAIQWCEENDIPFATFENLSRGQLLNKMHKAEGFVFLPKGKDTCPRVVIEAKILGCKLHINDNVQMATEAWFANGTIDSMIQHLKSLPTRFWNDVERHMDITSTIGAYTTTYNCVSQGYPFIDSIKSLLNNFDEVVVVDAGSTDGTWEILQELEGVRAYQHNVDFNHPRWAIHSDGDLKAKAREYVTTDWCWQMDSDEVIHDNIRNNIQRVLQKIPKAFDVVALPVIEYWGANGKVRADVNPWKWRLSRNKENITHGIPKDLRYKDENGDVYAGKGTDSCDYIDTDTYEILPHATFYSGEVHKLRLDGLAGHTPSINGYEDWMNQIIEELPTVYHYSWYDIKRKITSYKTHWSSFWKSMYDLDTEDTAENNVCFDKPWSEVSESDIEELSIRLENEKGGHIFHDKIDWSLEVPWITITKQGPMAE